MSESISLADILGPWVEPDGQSGLIERCRNACNTPLPELTNQQLATLLRQRFAVGHLLPIAQNRVHIGFEDDTKWSEGELQRAIDHPGNIA